MRSAHWWPGRPQSDVTPRHVLLIYAFLRFHGTSTAELAVAGQRIQVRAPSAAPDEGPAWVCCPGGEGDTNMRHGLRRHALVGVLVVAGMAAVGSWGLGVHHADVDSRPKRRDRRGIHRQPRGGSEVRADRGPDSPDAMTLLLPPGPAGQCVDRRGRLPGHRRSQRQRLPGSAPAPVTADAYGTIPIPRRSRSTSSRRRPAGGPGRARGQQQRHADRFHR